MREERNCMRKGVMQNTKTERGKPTERTGGMIRVKEGRLQMQAFPNPQMTWKMREATNKSFSNKICKEITDDQENERMASYKLQHRIRGEIRRKLIN